jgi:hypothetical protein
MFVNGGTYVKTYSNPTPQTHGRFDPDRVVCSDYAEQKGYRPSVIGHNGFRMRLVQRQEQGEKSWRLQLSRVEFTEW